MPSQLISARIRGVRSYSPREDETQSIDFMPLTLIVGKNGTGKTTIIESLKFIIAGEEPPHSDSRRNFIHQPRAIDIKNKKSQVNDHNYASIEIEFKNANNETCLARREITPAGVMGKNSTPAISSGYKINKGSWISVHRQDDWCKVMPRLFGFPNQAILSYVILCHQEDNQWCMGDSALVKQIFDKIFGCEQYKREIKHIDDEIKACKKEIQLGERDIDHHSEQVKRKKNIVAEIERVQKELNQSQNKMKALETEVEQLTKEKQVLAEDIKEKEIAERQITSNKQRVRELTERDKVLRQSLEPLLNRSKSVPERRPPPPPPIRPKKKNKIEQDPTAVGLEFVASKLADMVRLVDGMPDTDDVINLKRLFDEVRQKVDEIKQKFVIRVEEEDREEESEEDLHKKWYEQQEAASRAAEARRLEEDKKLIQSVETNIQNNFKELEKVKRQLEELESNAKSRLIGTDEKLQELKSIEQKLMSVRDRKSMMAGSCMQMERELSKLKAEEKSYWRANINYSESLGRTVCNKIIMSDLEKLKMCFHESISLFHDQMIVKINEVLRTRWRQIYQGKDIDRIEVVAEEVTRGKDKKSYNYYIAMSKAGTRMKMREKSSAGQRALASIILRTALAELFVKDFSFMALDEPTANLDLSNVQALAKSIGSYVRRRTKKGGNIQWIIITHDEEFLNSLDEESSPFFYRIQLNETGNSSINKCSSRENSQESTEADSQESSKKIKF